MDIKKNKIIRFNNGDYLVLNIIHHKGNTYLYLINNKEFEDDVSIVKVENNYGIIKYNYIDDEKEFDYVINKLFLENINDISDYFEE